MCRNQYGVNHNVNQMYKSIITIDTFITERSDIFSLIFIEQQHSECKND